MQPAKNQPAPEGAGSRNGLCTFVPRWRVPDLSRGANMYPATAMPTDRVVAGVFSGYAEARWGVEALRQAGYSDDRIGVVGPDRDHPNGHAAHSGLPNDPTHTRWEEGSGIGAAAGGAAGLGLGLAVAAGLMGPVGPVVAGGALVALLASAGAGATVGTVVGGLVGLGIPEVEAGWYAGEVDQGRVVVTVREGDGTGGRAADALRRAGGTVR